jgi:hypothetical protein
MDLGDARRTARPVLRQAESREALAAAARREARMNHGRRSFVLNERMLPVGLPLASLAGIVAYQVGGAGPSRRRRGRERRALAAIGAAATMVALSYGAALIEWELFEREYRRANDLDV